MKKEKDKRETKYEVALIVTTVSVLVTLAVGMLLFRFYMLKIHDTGSQNSFERSYVMITDDPKSSFWNSIYESARNEGMESGTYVDLLGENLVTDYDTEELMEIAISSSVDGIIVYADETEEMDELIDEATLEGIPVVTAFSDATLSKRVSFVGIGGYNVGREYGKQVINIIKEKRKENATSMYYESDRKVDIAILTDFDMDESELNVIVSGLSEELEAEKSANSNFSISFVSVDNTNAFSAEESIRDIFSYEEIPDVLLCMNEVNTTCAYQAVVDYNKVGEVSILGYYDSETILNAIAHNVIYATISIDTEEMGRYCVDALNEYIELGNTSQYFPVNVTLIDRNNVEQYLNKEESVDE